MNQDMLDDLALQKTLQQQFAVEFDIADVIARAVPVGMATDAVVFRAGGHVYLYIASQSHQVLDDMVKTARHMGCDIEHIYPPHGDADYFVRNASNKFKSMFPGKHITSDDDLRYYKNITAYNPALFRLSKVRGEIHGFDRESKLWRKVRDYSYTKIATS